MGEHDEAWVEVACEVADVIRHADHTAPSASRTDLDGYFGQPEVYTEWTSTIHFGDAAVLREWRYPSATPGAPDRKPCRHLVPARKTTPEEQR